MQPADEMPWYPTRAAIDANYHNYFTVQLQVRDLWWDYDKKDERCPEKGLLEPCDDSVFRDYRVPLDLREPEDTRCFGRNCATEMPMELHVETAYPEDISWRLTNSVGYETASGTRYERINFNSYERVNYTRIRGNASVCAGEEYTFTLSDSYGDGLQNEHDNGTYTLWLDGVLLYQSDGVFGSSSTRSFIPGTPPPPLLPPLPPLPPSPSPPPSPTSPTPFLPPPPPCPTSRWKLRLVLDEYAHTLRKSACVMHAHTI
jgi:hypothetical protein